MPRTGKSGAGPRNKKAALRLVHLEGRGPKKRHKPGLDRSGKYKRASERAPWTGATGGLNTEAPDRIVRGWRRPANRPGAEQKRRSGKRRQTADARKRPQGMDDRQGSRSSWAAGVKIKDRATPSMKKAKKREESMWNTGPGLEHPGQSAAQPWAEASRGVGRVPRAGTSGAGQRNTMQPRGLGNQGGRGPQPQNGKSGAEQAGEAVNNKSTASARTRPQGMEEHQGRASQHNNILGNTDSEQGMKMGTKEESMGTREQKNNPDKVSRAEHERTKGGKKEGSVRGESPTPSVRGGAAQNPGLDHPGEWVLGPGRGHPGRGQETRLQPPVLEQPEGRGGKKRR